MIARRLGVSELPTHLADYVDAMEARPAKQRSVAGGIADASEMFDMVSASRQGGGMQMLTLRQLERLVAALTRLSEDDFQPGVQLVVGRQEDSAECAEALGQALAARKGLPPGPKAQLGEELIAALQSNCPNGGSLETHIAWIENLSGGFGLG